ncbi:phosphate signaling complex protein PhoU [Vagococcus xieshaowenii]|uniref:Phosphate-specific transport system accessory protein PhoU n=1 Tax=Vagococcus xieshaowenii TaxID=2562451 RepID=A0AAJ5EG69_9ENTE|nr:phosphate signaling complex protein PhoU [Vagococcus xieshaowenii]QCA28812.1 phosphate signaling complex protein PhoU [Vagococcus xieshaowenii]TFZ42987.1 phosphate signaling complex protein PhoU [Vagococcus xieshaowenii]
MLRAQFEKDLRQLHEEFHTMGEAVSLSVYKAVRAFIKQDNEIAQSVIQGDSKINEFESDLEKKGLEMIALQQPVTSDLRLIITVMKAVNDLERIGDHAVSISKAAIRVNNTKPIFEIQEKISDMADDVLKLLDDALHAYTEGNSEEAVLIADRDEKINDYFKEIYEMCIRVMKEDSDLVEIGTDYLRVARFLERIGDYVTNICEWIIYLKTGKIVELHSSNDE